MTPDLMAAAAKLLGVLALIVGGLLAFNVYSRRVFKTGPGGAGKTLQVLESTPLGLKKSVTLVKVPGAVLVVGVTNERITLLDRVDGRDYEALLESRPTRPAPSFQDHLRKLTGGWQRTASDGRGAGES